MEEITLHNVDVEIFDEVIAALAWFADLNEIERYLAVDAITFEQWEPLNKMLAGAILYIGAQPQQTAIDVDALHYLAMLMTMRAEAEGLSG